LGADSEAARTSALEQSGPIYESPTRVQQIPSCLVLGEKEVAHREEVHWLEGEEGVHHVDVHSLAGTEED